MSCHTNVISLECNLIFIFQLKPHSLSSEKHFHLHLPINFGKQQQQPHCQRLIEVVLNTFLSVENEELCFPLYDVNYAYTRMCDKICPTYPNVYSRKLSDYLHMFIAIPYFIFLWTKNSTI